MDKGLLIIIFIWLLAITSYNEYLITGYATANINLIVSRPIDFDIFDGQDNPINISMDFYYMDTSIEYASHNMSGNKNISINNYIYDIRVIAYDSNFTILFKHADLSNFNRIYIGVDKLVVGNGDIVTYAVNKTFPMKNATLTILYASLSYSDESALNVFKCEDWNFLNRRCDGSFEKINATKDNIGKNFIFSVDDLSAFSIREQVGITEEKPSGISGGGGGRIGPVWVAKLPIKMPEKIPELPIKPPYLPGINVFLGYPSIGIGLSILIVYILLFILIYLMSRIIYKVFLRKKHI